MAGEDQLGEVDQFTYLGSIVDLKGGTDADIKGKKGKICLQKDDECVEQLKSHNKDKSEGFQLHNKTSVAVRFWDMEDEW